MLLMAVQKAWLISLKIVPFYLYISYELLFRKLLIKWIPRLLELVMIFWQWQCIICIGCYIFPTCFCLESSWSSESPVILNWWCTFGNDRCVVLVLFIFMMNASVLGYKINPDFQINCTILLRYHWGSRWILDS